ncbi:hypothetical protein MRX96_013865 [Rhipicephalus microplus]
MAQQPREKRRSLLRWLVSRSRDRLVPEAPAGTVQTLLDRGALVGSVPSGALRMLFLPPVHASVPDRQHP